MGRGPAWRHATMRELPRNRIVSQGEGYAVHECARHRDTPPLSSRPFEPIALRVVIVTSGLFRYRTPSRQALLTPGAMVIGEAMRIRDLEPVDGDAGTMLAFDYSKRLAASVQASMGPGMSASRSLHDGLDAEAGVACLPASKRTVRAFVLATQLAGDSAGDSAGKMPAADADSIAIAVLDTALTAAAEASSAERVAPELEMRIARALRHVERHHADDCSLDALAQEAGLGVFHFLRSFKRCVGQTPCQHVMAVRLREAAEFLATSSARVIDIAIDSGFGDLSHFNASFREAFGVQPSAYRKRYRTERMTA